MQFAKLLTLEVTHSVVEIAINAFLSELFSEQKKE
jgi:hypothetical protein